MFRLLKYCTNTLCFITTHVEYNAINLCTYCFSQIPAVMIVLYTRRQCSYTHVLFSILCYFIQNSISNVALEHPYQCEVLYFYFSTFFLFFVQSWLAFSSFFSLGGSLFEIDFFFSNRKPQKKKI